MRKIAEFQGENRFLSNFYLWPIEYDGVIWPSTEHLYQALKTNDKSEREIIRKSPLYKKDCAPGERPVKSLGRSCTMRPDWESVKLSVMEMVLRLKFVVGNEMAKRLIATGDSELVEGNSWGDHFYGVCDGKGENNLGKLLMKIRDELNPPQKQKDLF